MTVSQNAIGEYELPKCVRDINPLKRLDTGEQIEGFIHMQETRLTVIIQGENWHTYKLTERVPIEILKHERMDQTVVVNDYLEPGSLKLAGHMHSVKDDKSSDTAPSSSHLHYDMIVIDCNYPEQPLP